MPIRRLETCSDRRYELLRVRLEKKLTVQTLSELDANLTSRDKRRLRAQIQTAYKAPKPASTIAKAERPHKEQYGDHFQGISSA